MGDTFKLGDPDPYTDPCPSWCEGGHTVSSNDDDRTHYGTHVDVPVRSMSFEYTDGEYCVDGASIYLRRNTLHRDPAIWLGKGELAEGFVLTVDEAAEIADVLNRLVDMARADGGPCA